MEETIQVSILVAARNEEANIERCLRALAALKYPTYQLEILLGDDHSTDRTGTLAQAFIADKPQFRYVRISHQLPGLHGKANVLAQLGQRARGKYLLFCDADIAVPPGWVEALLGYFTPDTVGVVVGLTRIRPTSLLADFQSIEWLLALGGMRLLSLLTIPTTGMGNNMAVTSEAYRAVGGYETLGFSIVEDYALYRAIIERGYAFRQAYAPEVIAESEPVPTLPELLRQRKRWVKGAMQSQWFLRLNFLGAALFLPILMLLLVWNPWLGTCLAAAHYLLLTATSTLGLILLRQRDLGKTLPFFWFYFVINSTLMLLNYLRPSPTVWKGREYV
ncbi:hypothetical protein GCM10027275_14640 [Rhabdobacter roseus]|uniref:Cellulose synthase/poly-beta-1,6-N-acetylglucosamine synthase-like glycosyltransferase n=1 Tax=Rhabdobacter roseus TaxID=1655419 RepID=A0A840TIV8_9BACT|nr:glycosyltransferase [Rhabdobacter roseus]MBB5283384.1 cellulose synthase/poly-beta-1,6-N-acetylglucosamine synthase-like glycosyltransferase [Rhabdobacter roseus]